MHRHKTIITKISDGTINESDEKGSKTHDDKLESFLESIKGFEVIQMTSFPLASSSIYATKICTTIEYDSGDVMIVNEGK